MDRRPPRTGQGAAAGASGGVGRSDGSPSRLPDAEFAAEDLWSCTFLETLERCAVGVARLGEVGAAEEAVTQSGKTPSELASQWREHLSTLRRNFESSRR
jgi:hypothetical protein